MGSEGKLRVNPLAIETWLTAAAVTRGEVAHMTGSNTVINADANAEDNFGIFLEDADSGTYVKVCTLGLCLAVAYDDAITQSAELVAASDGRVDEAASAATGTTYVVAKARSGSDAAGQLIPVFVNPYTRSKAAS